MLGKKRVYGLITIIALGVPLFLNSAAPHTPPAGFEGLAQEYYAKPHFQDIGNAQITLGYPTNYPRGYADYAHALKEASHEEDTSTIRSLFDAMLSIGRYTGSIYPDISIITAPYYTRDELLDIRLLAYLDHFGSETVEGRWFTKLYLDWLIKHQGINSPYIEEFKNRYLQWVSGKFMGDETTKNSLITFINDLIESYKKAVPAPVSPEPVAEPVIQTPLPTPQQPELKEAALEPSRPESAAQASAPADFEGLAPEYYRAPNPHLLKDAKKVLEYNRYSEALNKFIPEGTYRPEEKRVAFFEAMLNTPEYVGYYPWGSSMAHKYYEGAMSKPLYTTDEIDDRLALYLNKFGTETAEGKWFTKLYLDWLIKKQGINSKYIEDFKNRYQKWISRKITSDETKTHLTNFINDLIELYKKAAPASVTPEPVAEPVIQIPAPQQPELKEEAVLEHGAPEPTPEALSPAPTALSHEALPRLAATIVAHTQEPSAVAPPESEAKIAAAAPPITPHAAESKEEAAEPSALTPAAPQVVTASLIEELFPGLAPEYWQEPSATLIQEAKDLIAKFKWRDSLADPNVFVNDFMKLLWQFLHGRPWTFRYESASHVTTEQPLNLHRGNFISSEYKQKARALFDALLSSSLQINKEVIDISKTPYLPHEESELDIRLLLYLDTFNAASVEGKWFTKLYLDWLIKNQGINSKYIEDFKHRYLQWISQRFKSNETIKNNLIQFIDDLIESYKKVAPAPVTSGPIAATPAGTPLPAEEKAKQQQKELLNNLIQQLPTFDKDLTHAQALQNPTERIHALTGLRSRFEKFIAGISRESINQLPTASAALVADIETAFDELAKEQEKIKEHQKIITEQLLDEINDIEQQLRPLEFKLQWTYSEQRLKTIMLAPVEERISDLTKLQSDVATSIQDMERVIARINDMKSDPTKFSRAVKKIEEFETRIKTIQPKLQALQPKVTANLATSRSELQKQQELVQSLTRPIAQPKQPTPPSAPESRQPARPAVRAPLTSPRPSALPTRATPPAKLSSSVTRVTPAVSAQTKTPLRGSTTARPAVAPVQPAALPSRPSALPTSTRTISRQITPPTTPAPLPKPSALPTSARTAPTRVTPPARSLAPVTRAVPPRAPAQAQPPLSRPTARPAVVPVQPAPLPSRPSSTLPTPSRTTPRQITRPTVAQTTTPRAPTRVTPPARSLAPVTRAVPPRAPAQAQPPLSRPAAAPTQPAPRSTSIRVTPPAARPAATRPLTTATQIRRPAAAPVAPLSRPTPRATAQPAPRPIPTRATPAARPTPVTRPSAVPPRSTAVMRQQAAREKERLAAQAKAAARTQSTKPGYRR